MITFRRAQRLFLIGFVSFAACGDDKTTSAASGSGASSSSSSGSSSSGGGGSDPCVTDPGPSVVSIATHTISIASPAPFPLTFDQDVTLTKEDLSLTRIEGSGTVGALTLSGSGTSYFVSFDASGFQDGDVYELSLSEKVADACGEPFVARVTARAVVDTTIFADLMITDCATYDPATRSCGGGSRQAYNTIGKAENAASAGSIIYVRAGTYNERVIINQDGTAEEPILFAAYPGDARPVLRGFDVTASHIKVIGFEITHESAVYNNGVAIVQSDHIEVIDNYLHHLRGNALRAATFDGTTSDHVTFRGNKIYWMACPNNAPGQCVGNGQGLSINNAHYVLLEYNEVQRCGDFANIIGTYSIVRNNYMHDHRFTYWPDAAATPHPDIFQHAGSMLTDTVHQFYDAIYAEDVPELDSHFHQMRIAGDPGSHHNVLRSSVGYRFGSYILQSGGIDRVLLYNNTFAEVSLASPNNGAFRWNSESGDPSVDNVLMNTVLSAATQASSAFIVDAGSVVEKSNNLCFSSGSDASCASTADPMVNDFAAGDLTLNAASPARALGAPLTHANGNGDQSLSLAVENAWFFHDGMGITEGDRILIGAGAPVRIDAIDWQAGLITLREARSWTNGDGVVLAEMASAASPDAGAFPYRAGGYAITADLGLKEDDQVPWGDVRLTASVNDPALARFVEFWVDGIPFAIDHEPPFEATWTAGLSAPESRHRIRIVVRPQYASRTLSVEDTAEVVVHSSAP